MGDPTPKLVVVSSRPDGETEGVAQPRWRRIVDSRALYWLIAAVLVTAIAGLGVQSRRVAELSGQVESLKAELISAQAALAAYEVRIDEIRTSVGGLQYQLDALDELVSRDPLAPTHP